MDRRTKNGVTAMLGDALEVEKGEMVVFVGAGGKTSAINRLGQEQVSCGGRVLLTTTTKIFPPAGLAYDLFLIGESEDLLFLDAHIVFPPKIIVIGKELNQEKKIIGLNRGQINQLKDKGICDVILVEGDGAKGKPFKAPRTFEPVIPEKADVVVPVLGIDCIGKPLNGTAFHAVEQIRLLTGLEWGDYVTEKDAAKVLLHSEGYQKSIPQSARWIPLINKVETPNDRRRARNLASILKESGVNKVLIGSVGVSNSLIEIC